MFNSLYLLAVQDDDKKKAHLLVDKLKGLAEVFDWGQYAQVSCELDLAVAEKDVEKTIAIAEKMLANMGELCAYMKSPLYEHMTFNEIDTVFLTEFREKLMENFRDQDTFGFLEQDERWQRLIK